MLARKRPFAIEAMLRTIEAEFAATAALTGRKGVSDRVLEAMAGVPREEFVPPALRWQAYDDNALPIGCGQTISQPYIVALMTDLLDPGPDDVVLEVGTGSGYQAAVLSRLVGRVYSLEIIPALAEEAGRRLRRLGCGNVEVRSGDGYRGWPEHAPFDGIVVTAAAGHIPTPLVEQLRPGGRLVIPVGLPWMPQELLLVEKTAEGGTRVTPVLGVAFVPLTRPEDGR